MNQENADPLLSRRLERLFYLLTVIGFLGTQAQLPHYLPQGLLTGTLNFWTDAANNPASLFLTVDILVLAAAVFVWMFSEARRLKIRFVWAYFLGSTLIGISIFVPLFMAMRQRQLRASKAATEELSGFDCVGIGFAIACALIAASYSVWLFVIS